jgi:hypothetical protein
MTVSSVDFLRFGGVYAVYVFLTSLLTGAVLISFLSPRTQARAPVEASAAIALLFGVSFQLVSWAGLRWAGLGYGGVAAFHAAAVLLLSSVWLDAERRRRGLAVLRSFFAAEAWLFWAVALAAAAYFTYAPIQNYYDDESLRLGFAAAAGRSFPAQNPFIWRGLLKYHYEADFYAGSTAAATGIPLPILYFRYLLPFNWSMLFFGLRGILKQAKSDAPRFWPAAVFGLFFLAHGNQVAHLTFRENSFALGLATLGAASLWTSLIIGDAPAAAAACAAAALVAFAKAPCGALYVVFVWILLALFAHGRRLSRSSAAVGALLSAGGFALVYRLFLTGAGTGSGGHLLKLGFDLGSLQEFAAYFPAPTRLLDGATPAVARDGIFLLENALTLLRLGALPLLAAAAFFLRESGPAFRRDASDQALLLKAALGVFAASAVLYCFAHYRISRTSDIYWVWFGLWFLSGASYSLLPLIPNPRELPRPLLGAGALIILAALAGAAASWPDARRLADSNVEGWAPEYYAACRYVDENAGPDDIVLHNIETKKHESLIGACGRRFFVSYSERDGVFEDFALTHWSWIEARAFFNGDMPRPLEWLRARGIRYVYWDFTGHQYHFAEVAARSPFLRPVMRDGSVGIYRVLDAAAGR